MDESKIIMTLEAVEQHLAGTKDPRGSLDGGGETNGSPVPGEMERFATPEALVAANKRFTLTDTTRIGCLKFYTKHSMDFRLSPETMYRVFISFYKHLPEDAVECFLRWKDAIPFIHDQVKRNLLCTMIKVCGVLGRCIPEQTFFFASSLYEYGEVEICYQVLDLTLSALDEVAFIPSWKEKNEYPEFTRVNILVDCCKFLYISEEEKYYVHIESSLKRFLDCDQIPSDVRLRALKGFCGNNVSFFTRSQKLATTPDATLVKHLHLHFIFESKPEKKDAVLACTHLLKEKETTPTELEMVQTFLEGMGGDKTLSESVRATALGCLVDNSPDKHRALKALYTLKEMGMESSGKRFKTIYDSSQNVHDTTIEKAVLKALENLQNNNEELFLHIGTVALNRVLEEFETHLQTLPSEKRFRVRRTLNRVMTDMTTFTDRMLSLSDLLCMVWQMLKKEPYTSSRPMYLQRLVNELDDMDTTFEDESRPTTQLVSSGCSWGYAARLVNSLCGPGNQMVEISWEDQIKANIQGRLFKLMREIADEDQKGLVLAGIMETADQQEIAAYDEFVERHKTGLYDELKHEFVGGGYLSGREFDGYFQNGFPKR